jgi:AcrR family transcriptional regulator
MAMTKRSRKENADRSRERIVRAAAKLFNGSGYHHTTMGAVAEAIGLRKPTLYHYVKSKEEILYWIHEELIDRLTRRHRERLSTRLTTAQLLLEVQIDILETIAEYPGYVRAFFEHYRELNAEMRAGLKRKRDAYFAMIVDVIRFGVERGEVRTDDANLTALAFLGMINWSYHWYRPDGPRRLREIAHHFCDIFLHGVAVPAVRVPRGSNGVAGRRPSARGARQVRRVSRTA